VSGSDYSYEETPLTITRLEVENVKRIKLVRLTPEGSVVVIGGANDQGKSSLTDAIRMLLGGEREVPETALRRGARHGHVIGQLGDELLVERTFREGGKTSLRVTDLDGRPVPGGPQTILARLYNALTFDPLNFAQAEGKEAGLKQAKMLQEAIGLDFSEVDQRRAKLVAERSGANRTVRDLEGRHRGAPFHLGVPKQETSAAEILARGAAHSGICAKRETAQNGVARAEERVSDLESEIARLTDELTAANIALKSARQHLVETPVPPEFDAVAASIEITRLEETNKKVRENAARADIEEQLESARAETARLDGEIDQCDAEKAEAMAAASFPVQGLSFRENDGSLLLNGLPLEQAAESQRIRLSVAIGFALNPRLKVLLVRQGSELDSNAMRLLAEIADEHGGQVWVERVSEDGAGCSVVLEDGEVRAEPARAAE
jgi:chromosome segregation ATPase